MFTSKFTWKWKYFTNNQMKMKLNLKNVFLYLSVLTFIISLFLPVHLIFTTPHDYFGYIYASLGWMSFPNLDFFCWISNFTLLLGWFFYKKKIGLIFNLLTLILMSLYGINHILELDFFIIDEYSLPLFGYWFWLLSPIFLLVSQIKQHNNGLF